MPPQTRYTRSGDIHIAYQVVGDGPMDLVYVPGWVSNVELCWDDPDYARFLNRLASFSRLIMFDKRGTGLSDRVPNNQLPTLEERADDLRVVMDAAGSEQAALFGVSEGGNLCAFVAATYPERTTALIMAATFAKRVWSADYPWAPRPEQRKGEVAQVERDWGKAMDLERYAPSRAKTDPDFVARMTTYFRRSASPGAAAALLQMNTQIDISGILSAISVPTLILQREADRDVNVEEARWIASRIEGAKLKVMPGDDHFPWLGDQDLLTAHIQEFLTGEMPVHAPSRVLATILITDIVGSTETARQMGDTAWKELLNAHDAMCRRVVGSFAGSHLKSTGDGILATFDGPGRGIACARRIVAEAEAMGIGVRAGLHTGECELRGEEISGVAVHLSARISALAERSEILVSRTVRDLVAGSDVSLEPRGAFRFKGFDEEWPVFAVSLPTKPRLA